jgi:hypothetical protein
MNATQTNEERELAENQQQAEWQIEGFAWLGKMLAHRQYTEFPTRLDERIDERQEREREGVLSVEVDRTVRIVLCTGGPHCEVRWPEHGDPSIVCYGWFGAGRYERPLTNEELAGIEYAVGDWDYLAGIEQ